MQWHRAASTGQIRGCLLLWTSPLHLKELDDFWVHICLECLSVKEVQDLVQKMLYHLEPPPWLSDLERVTGGDPRWVVDLVRAQVERGLPHHLIFNHETIECSVHFETLPAATREILNILACITKPLPPTLLLTIYHEASLVIEDILRRELATLTTSGLWLSNPVIKNTLIQTLSPNIQKDIHRRLAETFEKYSPQSLRQIAYHWLSAGEVEKGVRALIQTTDASREELCLATKHLRPDTDSKNWIWVQTQLAHRERAHGDLNAARSIAHEVRNIDEEAGMLLEAELLHDMGQPQLALEILANIDLPSARLLLLRARSFFAIGDLKLACDAAHKGKDIFATKNHHAFSDEEYLLHLELTNVANLAAVYQGDAEAGVFEFESEVDLLKSIRAKELLARRVNNCGIALQRLGRLAEAGEAFETSLKLSRESGDLHIAATALLNLGTTAQRLMQYDTALEYYRQAYQLATRGGIVTTRIWSLGNQANLLLIFGDLIAAAHFLEDAEQIAVSSGGRALLGHVLLYRSDLWLMRSEIEAAERDMVHARECFDPNDRSGIDAADLMIVEIYLRREMFREAISISRKLLGRMDAADPDRWRAHLGLGKALLLQEFTAPSSEERTTKILSAIRELTLASAQAEIAGTFERSWECYVFLVKAFRANAQNEEADFYFQQLNRALKKLLESIPSYYRQTFEKREDILAAISFQKQLTPGQQFPLSEGVKQLLQINKELSINLPQSELLRRILDGAIEFTGAERGFILLEKNGHFIVAASRNMDRERVIREGDKFSRTIALKVLSDNRPLLTTDAMEDPRFTKRCSVKKLKLRAVLCTPFGDEKVFRGVLYLDNRFRPGIFNEEHLDLLQAFADQASIALQHASLIQEVVHEREALARAKSELEVLNAQLGDRVERQSKQLHEMTERLRNQEQEILQRYNASNIIGRSKPIQDLFRQMDRVAEADVSVFIWGESGTGKELIARAIHWNSERSHHPFITVNCAAIPSALLESELFGHTRGAFTGAVHDRVGLFEAAGTGTILLDEVGDMPLEMQVKLLRILQNGSFRRVGEERERQSRCRILSASHQPLSELVQSGRFRQDLYYRLNVFQLNVPPLRERRMDIPLLVDHILKQQNKTDEVTPAAMAALIDYDWPGNIRQLENEIQRAALLANGPIDVQDLSSELWPRGQRNIQKAPIRNLQISVEEYERQLIQHALDRTNYNITQAAKELGIHRVALHKKIQKLGVEKRKRTVHRKVN